LAINENAEYFIGLQMKQTELWMDEWKGEEK
jgi:hypothetical protein